MFSIHRHWFWANRIREEYYERLKADPPNDGDLLAFFLQGHGMYLCLWYGLLFTVCEAIRAHRFVVPQVEQEIKDIYKSLKLFRNSIFHIQPDYFSEKMFNVLNDKICEAKISKVHGEIGEWFDAQILAGPKSPIE